MFKPWRVEEGNQEDLPHESLNRSSVSSLASSNILPPQLLPSSLPTQKHSATLRNWKEVADLLSVLRSLNDVALEKSMCI